MELVAAVLSKNPANEYFANFEVSLSEKHGKRECWESYESKFSFLSEPDWQLLKAKAVPRFSTKDPRRSWQTAIDVLNEAIAYCYLVAKGCSNVKFVAESNTQKTPDLQCVISGHETLCEVKTFNISDEAISLAGSVQTVSDQLPQNFLDGKLKNTMSTNVAKFDYIPSATKVYFFVMNFDDGLHEYADRYFEQIGIWLQSQKLPVDGLIFLDNSTLWRGEPLVLELPKGLWGKPPT